MVYFSSVLDFSFKRYAQLCLQFFAHIFAFLRSGQKKNFQFRFFKILIKRPRCSFSRGFRIWSQNQNRTSTARTTAKTQIVVLRKSSCINCCLKTHSCFLRVFLLLQRFQLFWSGLLGLHFYLGGSVPIWRNLPASSL